MTRQGKKRRRTNRRKERRKKKEVSTHFFFFAKGSCNSGQGKETRRACEKRRAVYVRRKDKEGGKAKKEEEKKKKDQHQKEGISGNGAHKAKLIKKEKCKSEIQRKQIAKQKKKKNTHTCTQEPQTRRQEGKAAASIFASENSFICISHFFRSSFSHSLSLIPRRAP